MSDDYITHRVARSSDRTLCCGVHLEDVNPADHVTSRVEATTCRPPGKRIA